MAALKNVPAAKRCVYRMDRRQISFVKFILEGYDNVAVVTTLDAGAGLVLLTVAPGCDRLVEDILHSLTDEVEIVSIGAESR